MRCTKLVVLVFSLGRFCLLNIPLFPIIRINSVKLMVKTPNENNAAIVLRYDLATFVGQNVIRLASSNSRLSRLANNNSLLRNFWSRWFGNSSSAIFLFDIWCLIGCRLWFASVLTSKSLIVFSKRVMYL